MASFARRLFIVVLAVIWAPSLRAEGVADIMATFIPFDRPGEKPAEKSKKTEQLAQALLTFTSLTFVSSDDAKNYAPSMQRLVGNYAYVDEASKKLVLLGRSVTGKEIDVQLKDGTVFRAVIKNEFNAALGLPFLKVDLKDNQIAELNIQDVGLVQSNFTADEIGCRVPFSYRDANSPKIYYLAAATATTVSKRVFEEKGGGGGLVVSILNLGGKTYYSSELIERQNVISVSLVPTKAIPNDNAVCASLLKSSSTNPALAGTITYPSEVRDDFDSTSPSEEYPSTDIGSTNALRGAVLSVVSGG